MWNLNLDENLQLFVVAGSEESSQVFSKMIADQKPGCVEGFVGWVGQSWGGLARHDQGLPG